MSGIESFEFSIWSREEDKIFEKGLATYPEDLQDRWEKIAAHIPGKSVQDIKQHYMLLLDDIYQIESGCVPLPCYDFSLNGLTGVLGNEETGCVDGGKSSWPTQGEKGGNVMQFGVDGGKSSQPEPGEKGGNVMQFGVDGGKSSQPKKERRKGTPWTEDEHRLFLQGLDKYSKGDWRSISRNCVVTRTPTQVASHAQKYFIRLSTGNKDKRRTSIHDITNVNNISNVSVLPGLITGNTNGSSGEPSQQAIPPSLAASSEVGQYDNMEQPVSSWTIAPDTPFDTGPGHILH